MSSPLFEPFLQRRGYVLLDGGLATELEKEGHDLNDSLWSAKILTEDPDAILRAHLAFLESGADCIVTSSYQATPQGLVARGHSPEEARQLIRKSYDLAAEACARFIASTPESGSRPAPLVAASIGPYGAYLADGSEYTGRYDIDVPELVEFHRERFELLADLSALLAIETIPSLPEAEAFRRLFEESPAARAWVSFACRDGERISDGSLLRDAVAPFDDLEQVVAVGVNCTSPDHVTSLIDAIRDRGTHKEIVVYPNSGARYCVHDRSWSPEPTEGRVVDLVGTWRAKGARLIGGCCQIDASDLSNISQALER
ncbi:MAG: homocysteine S-methyltransferase [Planctomycetota bacterium]